MAIETRLLPKLGVLNQMITSFNPPITRYQCLANGFISGSISIEDRSILTHDKIVIPMAIREDRFSKVQQRINILSEYIIGVYPRTVDGKLLFEVSNIFLPNEVDPDLIDRFRLRGEITYFDGDRGRLKIITRTNASYSVEFFSDGEYYELDLQEFWELNCTRIGKELIITGPNYLI